MTNRPFASRTCAVIDARGKVTIRSERQTQCPNRVKSCPDGPEVRLQLYPRKRTQLGHHAMSEKCQQRKSESFDHLVGARQQGGRYRQSERLGGLHIDDELETSRLLDRQVCGLSAFEDLVDVHGSLSKKVGIYRGV